jgi:hypothetical protein
MIQKFCWIFAALNLIGLLPVRLKAVSASLETAGGGWLNSPPFLGAG